MLSRFQSRVPGTPEELLAWHQRPGAFLRLVAPFTPLVAGSGRVDGEVGWPGVVAGQQFRFQVRPAGVPLTWSGRILEVREGGDGAEAGFEDELLSGPFRRFHHRHRFRMEGGKTLLDDALDWELPAWAGWLPGARGHAAATLDQTFAWRHAVTQRDLADHAAFPPDGCSVLVTGATGLVGSALLPRLTTAGHRVIRADRRATMTDAEAWPWSPNEGLRVPDGETPGALVHLAGENIAAGRWTDARKRRIRESRVAATRKLAESLVATGAVPPVVVAASAVGFYGSGRAGTVTEEDGPGTGFLAEVCREWEAALDPLRAAGARVVTLRLGVVIDPRGGALARMLPPFRLGVGGPLGAAGTPVPWIGLQDLVRLIHRAILDPRYDGVVNAVAPEAADQGRLARTLGRVLRRPALLPVPGLALKALLGEMAEALLLSGAAVRPRRLEELGFDFWDPTLESALRRCLGRMPTRSVPGVEENS